MPALTRRPGIENLIRIIDSRYSREQLAGLYGSFHLLIHTAEWEGFGIPVAEALSSGVPVVTHPIQGPGEIVPYVDLLVRESAVLEDAGTILREIDVEAAAGKVCYALDDPIVLRRVSQEGREYATRALDSAVVAAGWIDLIEDFINR